MKNIAAALVKAQQAFGPALKTNTNPAFKSKYADLSACIEAVIDALNTNGIMLMQKVHETDSGVTVETVFIHESGEEYSAGKLHVPATKQDAQGHGSALTYARRYSLMAACGIAPEDDDGNAASKKVDRAPEPQGLSAKVIADHIKAIEGATRETLKTIYAKAKDAAIKANDHSAAEQFLTAQKAAVARLTQSPAPQAEEPEDIPY